jgi:hypothetical protein
MCQSVNLTQASLNGCSAEIEDYVEQCKRWTIQVRVNNNETTLNIKAENLIVVKTETKNTVSTCRDFDIGQWTPGHGRGGGARKAAHSNNYWWWCVIARFQAVGRNRYFHRRFCVITVPCV